MTSRNGAAQVRAAYAISLHAAASDETPRPRRDPPAGRTSVEEGPQFRLGELTLPGGRKAAMRFARRGTSKRGHLRRQFIESGGNRRRLDG